MSCTVCYGMRDGETWAGKFADMPKHRCKRKTECIKAAPQYFTQEERRAVGAVLAREPAKPVEAKLRAKARDPEPPSELPAVEKIRAFHEKRGRYWRQTRSGRQMFPLDPVAGEFALDDIVWGLANLPRYGGQASKFYSVAEHSVLVSLYVEPAYAREGLMHEIDEAVTGVDMAGPLKAHPLMKPFRDMCDAITEAGFEQFGIRSTPISKSKVREIDLRILHDERRELFGPPPADWSVPGSPLGCPFVFAPPDVAKDVFLIRFRELFPEYTGP